MQVGWVEEGHTVGLDPVAARGLVPGSPAYLRLLPCGEPDTRADGAPDRASTGPAVGAGAARPRLEVAVGEPRLGGDCCGKVHRTGLHRGLRLLGAGLGGRRDLQRRLCQGLKPEAVAIEQLDAHQVHTGLGVTQQHVGHDLLAGFARQFAHLARAAIDAQSLSGRERPRMQPQRALTRLVCHGRHCE